MKNIKEIYPKALDKEYGYGLTDIDYQPMIDEIGKVIYQKEIGTWQGDTLIFYKKGTSYGFLTFGWGSCRGCDALKACNDYNDLEYLFNDLLNKTKWFDSLEEIQKYFNEKDFELEWYYDEDGVEQFVDYVKNYKEN